MSAWTRARHDETGGEAILPVDALPNMPYWKPIGDPADSVAELQIQIDQEKADAEEASAARADDAAEAVEDGAIVAEVLVAVGDDPVAAQAALDAEQAKPARQRRKTLVDQLGDIVNRAPENTDQAAEPAATEKD